MSRPTMKGTLPTWWVFLYAMRFYAYKNYRKSLFYPVCDSFYPLYFLFAD